MPTQKNKFFVATTQEEIQVATILYSEEKTIRERFLSKNEEEQKAVHNEIVEFMGLWTITAGASRLNDMELTAIYTAASKFIGRNYGFLKVSDLHQALEYATMNELDCDTRLYNGIISIEYVSRILKAYCYKRKELIQSIDKQTMSKRASLPTPPPPPSEQAKMMREIIQTEYDKYKECGHVYDSFDFIYDFCYKSGRLKFVTKRQMLDAAKWGREKAMDIFKNKMGPRVQADAVSLDNLLAMGDNQQHVDKASKKFARIYCLKLLFDSVDLDKFLQGISENDFAESKLE